MHRMTISIKIRRKKILKDLPINCIILCSDKICNKELWIYEQAQITAAPYKVAAYIEILITGKLTHLGYYFTRDEDLPYLSYDKPVKLYGNLII